MIQTLSREAWDKLPTTLQQAAQAFQAKRIYWPEGWPELPPSQGDVHYQNNVDTSYTDYCQAELDAGRVDKNTARTMKVGLEGTKAGKALLKVMNEKKLIVWKEKKKKGLK